MATKELLTTILGRRLGVDHLGNVVVNRPDGLQIVIDNNIIRYDPVLQELVTADGYAVSIQATDLGVLLPVVQSLIDQAFAKAIPLQGDIALTSGQLAASRLTTNSGPAPGMTYEQVLQYLMSNPFGGGAPSAPVKVNAPTLNFPPSATVTISNASPAVVSWASHGKAAGDPVRFTTTGGLPTGLTANQQYYVIAAGLAAGTFQVSATLGGAAINTSSAGSGTHTGWSSPDVSEQPTIVAGTYSTGTGIAAITGRTYQYKLGGTLELNADGSQRTWSPTGASGATLLSAAAGLSCTLVEYGAYGVGQAVANESTAFTVNALASPKPVNTSVPTINISGTTATMSSGVWSGATTSFTYQFFNGNPNAGGTVIQSSATATLDVSLLAGVQLYPRVIANNGATASNPADGPFVTVSGGSAIAVTKKAPIGFVYAASYPSQVAVLFDYGLQPGTSTSEYWNNNPSSFTIIAKAGKNIVASGTNLTQYLPSAADVGLTLTYTALPSNGAGPGELVYSDGIDIIQGVGGGGGGTPPSAAPTFISAAHASAYGAVTTVSMPSGAQAGYFALMVREFDNLSATYSANPTATSGTGPFTQSGTVTRSTGDGEGVEIWGRVLTSSEPPSWSNTLGSNMNSGATIALFSNCTGIQDDQPASTSSGNATPETVNWPAATYSAANQVHVLVAVPDCSTGVQTMTWTLPAGYTLADKRDFLVDGTPNANSPIMIAVCSTPSTAAGSTGAKSGSVSFNGGGTAGYVVRSIVLKP